MKKKSSRSSQKGISAIIFVIIGLALIVGLAFNYYFKTHANKGSNNSANITSPDFKTSTPKPTQTPTPDQTVNWKVYKSNLEKASFKYPPDWIVVTPQQPSVNGADTFTIQSPNGDVKVEWVSAITGLGGGCGEQCPIYNVFNKTAISGAEGLYVVSAFVDDGNGNIRPWVAVQDRSGILSSGKQAGFGTFMGRNNGGGKGDNYSAIFAFSDIYGDGPVLSQSQAGTYFQSADVQEAKLILLSLRY